MAKQIENRAYLRAHDDVWLLKRWRTLTRRLGWKMTKFAMAGAIPLYVIETPQRPGSKLYLSAGIHGDEPAAPEALLAWCERRAAALKTCELLIFPCLNPWGLRNNCRSNAEGLDLNRCYHREDVPMIAAQKKIVGKRIFDAAIMMHEDFDAQGIYLYEIPNVHPLWGEKLIVAASRHIPPEPRSKVEGRTCRNGLIRVRVTPKTMPEHPEAFFLRFGHTARSLTIETPSEFSMSSRVAAHGAVLDEVLKLVEHE